MKRFARYVAFGRPEAIIADPPIRKGSFAKIFLAHMTDVDLSASR
jgi:hypothetical protein